MQKHHHFLYKDKKMKIKNYIKRKKRKKNPDLDEYLMKCTERD